MKENTAHRVAILEKASNLISGDRNEQYGDFGLQMESIAQTFNALNIGDGNARFLTARDIATILMILKLRRRITATGDDSSVDLCGYAALDGEYFSRE